VLAVVAIHYDGAPGDAQLVTVSSGAEPTYLDAFIKRPGAAARSMTNTCCHGIKGLAVVNHTRSFVQR
jgi:hypothetical protein